MARKRPSAPAHEGAGIYVRVSLNRVAHGLSDELLSPETQQDRGRAYCAAQGWAVAAVEQDIDESAYRQHYSQREGLIRLLEAIDRGELTKIVVWKFSRLSRRLKEFTEICDRVEAAGGGVVSVTEQVDTSTPAGRLIRNVLASFAQFQSEEISEQIFESWMTKAKRGERPPGIAPFGTVNEKGILVADPAMHAHLSTMFRVMRDTRSLTAVWDYLTDGNVPPPRAENWNLITIKHILTNPVYVAQLDWAGESFTAKWEPLVPAEVWEDVQSIFKARKTQTAPRRDASLLTGFVACSLCGRPMWIRYVGRRRNGERFLERTYACYSRFDKRMGCEIPVVSAEELETAAWEAALLIATSADLNVMISSHLKRGESTGDPPAMRIHQLQTERERIAGRVATLFDLLGDESITREQFREQNLRYVERIRAIEEELRRAPAVPIKPHPAGIRAAAAAAPAATTDKERRELLQVLQPVVEVSPTRIYLNLLGMRVNLRARRIGDTFHLGKEYQHLAYQGFTLSDKQTAFVLRAYDRCDKQKLAARIGRSYKALVHLVTRMRERSPQSVIR